MTTPRYTGPFSGEIAQATGQVISYIRDEKRYRLAKYVQYIQSPSNIGVYARVHRDDTARVVTDNDFIFADGADAPQGDWNQLRFEWVEFSTKRRAYPFRIGYMAVEAAKNSWKVKEQHIGLVTMQCYTNRTNRVISMLETSTNWTVNSLDHAKDVNDLNGGKGRWDLASGDAGSPHYNAILDSLLAAATRINLDTNGVVEPGDLVLLVSPNLARKMASSSEVHDYKKYGPYSKAELESKNNPNLLWGLPPSLYGFDVVVEDTPYVNSRPKADGSYATGSNRQYAKADTSAVLLSRKGGINGNYGAPSFSTVQLYWHKWEAAVEMFDDPVNLRLNCRILDNFAEVLAAPEAGMLLTNCI